MPRVLKDRCPADHPCPLVTLCPAGAVSQEGFAAPAIEDELCIECGVCSERCPYRAVASSGSRASA
jgi:ferredoxin